MPLSSVCALEYYVRRVDVIVDALGHVQLHAVVREGADVSVPISLKDLVSGQEGELRHGILTRAQTLGDTGALLKFEVDEAAVLFCGGRLFREENRRAATWLEYLLGIVSRSSAGLSSSVYRWLRSPLLFRVAISAVWTMRGLAVANYFVSTPVCRMNTTSTGPDSGIFLYTGSRLDVSLLSFVRRIRGRAIIAVVVQAEWRSRSDSVFKLSLQSISK